MGILGLAFTSAAMGTITNAASPQLEAKEPNIGERLVSHVSKLGM